MRSFQLRTKSFLSLFQALSHYVFYYFFMNSPSPFFFFFFFNDPPPPEISPLSLPAALPICATFPASTFPRFFMDKKNTTIGVLLIAAAFAAIVFSPKPTPPPLAPKPVVSANATSTPDRESTRLNSSHLVISYAVFCLKKKKT